MLVVNPNFNGGLGLSPENQLLIPADAPVPPRQVPLYIPPVIVGWVPPSAPGIIQSSPIAPAFNPGTAPVTPSIPVPTTVALTPVLPGSGAATASFQLTRNQWIAVAVVGALLLAHL